MEELERLEENRYEGVNSNALRKLDIQAVHNKLEALEERIEEVEYLIYEVEDWIKPVIYEGLINGDELDRAELTDVLTEDLAKQAMKELYAIK